ncbi:MAG: SUMF1/EgtB/PvdO family nonheme iron enzyme [Gammaproteobacteria bacterium]
MSKAVRETPVNDGFFQTGGTLKADAPSYIERPADRELHQSVLAGEYCYVLTPRQMGKSSLMTRIAARLRQEGVHVAVVDLTGIGGDAGSMTAEQWYYGLANRLLRELEIPLLLAEWWKDQSLLPPLNRLMNFFHDVILSRLEGRIAVFFDEIDTTINLPFSDDFFAAIRACFNARANQAEFNRICFVLLGVASPTDLIRDAERTPFNIGRRIDLADFDLNQARRLSQGLSNGEGVADRLLKRVLHWTNGHPYLTQKLCVQVQMDDATNETPEARVDRVVAAEFLGVGRRAKEDNLRLIHDRIAKAGGGRPKLLTVYGRVRRGKRIQDQPQSPIHSALKLSGLVKADAQGRLVVRNRIYERVFDARWIGSLQPSRWKQRSALGTLVLVTLVFGWWIGAQQLTVRSGFSIVLAWLGIAYPEPELVEIPVGSFRMGSPDNEEDRQSDEGPQHVVSIGQRFLLGKYEVTFDEYDVFAFLVKGDGGCSDGHEVTRPSDEGWGRGRRPVINVSWSDANCYAEWLSRKTGKRYRLPTEAEWEYAARAGTDTPRPWPGGPEAACRFANVFDQKNVEEIKKRYVIVRLQPFPCPDAYAFTAPAGSFPANLGVHDVLGNVWEWVQDCYHENYNAAPADGKAWEENGCSQRVIRGGAWFDEPENLRSARRFRFSPVFRNFTLGFRLAQDL